MDIRLFKFLIFLFFDALFGGSFFLLRKFPVFPSITPFITDLLLILIIAVPVIILLPEDNWIWLLEEDPRVKKISVYEKAAKHLHLSTLYLFAFGFPLFVICLNVFIRSSDYRHATDSTFFGIAAVGGVYCAVQNYLNVKKNVSLFAVGWDRRSSFFGIFVDFNVSRTPRFFYPKFIVFAAVIFFASALYSSPWGLFFAYSITVILRSSAL